MTECTQTHTHIKFRMFNLYTRSLSILVIEPKPRTNIRFAFSKIQLRLCTQMLSEHLKEALDPLGSPSFFSDLCGSVHCSGLRAPGPCWGCCLLNTPQQANGFWAERNTRRLGSTIDMQRIPDLENSPESQLQFIDPGSTVLKLKMNRPAGSYLLVTGWLDVDARDLGQAHEPTQGLLCLPGNR